MHSVVSLSDDEPAQSSPPLDGAGFVHVLVRDLTDTGLVKQGLGQAQDVQVVQTPVTIKPK